MVFSSGRIIWYIFFIITLFALGSAAKIPNRPENLKVSSKAVENYYDVDRDGRYIMRYETPGGIIHFEIGYLRRSPDGSMYQVKEGYYIYPTADGKKVRLAYFADKDGYRVIAYDIRESPFEELENQNVPEIIDS